MDGAPIEPNRRDSGRKWRHEVLAASLRDEIAGGAYAPGELLPTERAIAEANGLSRSTVREALRTLEVQGMIRRRQGSGTVVIARRPQGFLQPLDSLDMLMAYPANTAVRMVEARPAAPEDLTAAELDANDGRRWHRLRLQRFGPASTTPISEAHVFVVDDHRQVLHRMEGSKVPAFRHLEHMFGVKTATVDLRMEATDLSEAQATALGVLAGTAAIRVRRTYRDAAGVVVAFSFTYHAAGCYAFELSLPVADKATSR